MMGSREPLVAASSVLLCLCSIVGGGAGKPAMGGIGRDADDGGLRYGGSSHRVSTDILGNYTVRYKQYNCNSAAA